MDYVSIFTITHTCIILYPIINYIAIKRNPVTCEVESGKRNSLVEELEVGSSEFLAATLSWSYTLDYYNKWGKKGLKLAKETYGFVIRDM